MNRPLSADWYRFFIACHARPESLPESDPKESGEASSAPLAVSPADLTRPLAVSFEEACVALSELPRMFCELDGSFVWRSADERDWQVDGVLYEAGHGLMYVELKGHCPAAAFDSLLGALGHDRVPLVFQLVREGLVLDEAAFRRWAVERWEDRGARDGER